MITHLFDGFTIDKPKRHPMNGDVVLAYTDEDSQQKYVFPIELEDAEAYYEAIGELLGKGKPKLVTANMEDVKRATRTG